MATHTGCRLRLLSYSLVIPPTSDDYYIFAHALGEAQFWAIVAVRISHTYDRLATFAHSRALDLCIIAFRRLEA